MIKRVHLMIAKELIDENTRKIDKMAYLFGSIAPDINCIYPMHTYNKTKKRFKRKFRRFIRSRHSVIRSFTAGVLTHYICDYFCYAHNREKVDVWHAMYERNMEKYISRDSQIPMREIHIRIDELLENLMYIHQDYLRTVGEKVNKQWYKSEDIVSTDLKYAICMSRVVADTI